MPGPNYINVNGNCYYVKETRSSINDAMKYCQTAFGSGHVGKLYEPKDKATHDLVIKAYNGIVQDWPRSRSRFGDWLWLGINDKSSEGQFQYLTTGDNLLFSNWRTGQLLYPRHYNLLLLRNRS